MNIAVVPAPRARLRTSTPIPGALDLSARLVAILACVTGLIFARSHIFAALAHPLHNRIAGASRRIASLLARLAEGKFFVRRHTPRPGAKGGPPPINLPRRRAWLVVKLGYHVAGFGSQLEHLLRDPQTLATLAAAPPEALHSLGRNLRPLCRLLGVTIPPELQLAARPPARRKPKPAKPARRKPALGTPPRPVYPQSRPRFILHPNSLQKMKRT